MQNVADVGTKAMWPRLFKSRKARNQDKYPMSIQSSYHSIMTQKRVAKVFGSSHKSALVTLKCTVLQYFFNVMTKHTGTGSLKAGLYDILERDK